MWLWNITTMSQRKKVLTRFWNTTAGICSHCHQSIKVQHCFWMIMSVLQSVFPFFTMEHWMSLTRGHCAGPQQTGKPFLYGFVPLCMEAEVILKQERDKHKLVAQRGKDTIKWNVILCCIIKISTWSKQTQRLLTFMRQLLIRMDSERSLHLFIMRHVVDTPDLDCLAWTKSHRMNWNELFLWTEIVLRQTVMCKIIQPQDRYKNKKKQQTKGQKQDRH